MLLHVCSVGVGFSYTESDAGYVVNEDEVAADMYAGLTQFFTVFPDLLNNDFYVTGTLTSRALYAHVLCTYACLCMHV